MARVSAGVAEGPGEASLLLRAGDLTASVVEGLHLGEKYNATIVPSTNEGLRDAAAWLAAAGAPATEGEHR